MEELPKNNSEQEVQLDPAMQSLADMADKMGENAEKEQGGKVNRVYGEIAKNALMNWNGLSEQEASEKVASSTFDELETQIGAEGSITAAVSSIMENLEKRGLVNHEERYDIRDDLEWGITENRDEDFDISMGILSERLGNVEDKEEFVLDVLNGVHKSWIEDNMEKLNDHNRVSKRYQFMPLSVIGFKEAKADLIFTQPILEAAGMDIDLDKLQDTYADYGKGVKELFRAGNKYEMTEYMIDFQNINPEPYEYVLRVLNFSAQYYQVSVDESFGVDFSNVEGGDFNVIEQKKVTTTPEWGAYDRYSSYEENQRAAEEAELGWATVTEVRKPNRQEYAARYAMEIANQVIDKLENDR